MICPKCMRSEFITINGDTHYICLNDPLLPKEETGCGTQFIHKPDHEVKFPYNTIFMDRGKEEFYRNPYLIKK